MLSMVLYKCVDPKPEVGWIDSASVLLIFLHSFLNEGCCTYPNPVVGETHSQWPVSFFGLVAWLHDHVCVIYKNSM